MTENKPLTKDELLDLPYSRDDDYRDSFEAIDVRSAVMGLERAMKKAQLTSNPELDDRGLLYKWFPVFFEDDGEARE